MWVGTLLPVCVAMLPIEQSTRPFFELECEQLGPAVSQHSCFHAEYGPFETVVATPGAVSSSATPNVDAVHTLHRVGLVRDETSIVTYEPLRDGAWSFFTDAPLEFEVLENSTIVEPTFLADGDTGCDALPSVRVFELQAGIRYDLRFAPTQSASVLLVAELLDDFLSYHGRDDDGDGYGRSDDTVVSVCAPPAGYAPNDRDCNDADPEIHPDATERCDDIDRNCNGSPTDEGLPCSVGVGDCEADGTWMCNADGSLAQCAATAGTPSPERCNGIDDDCDGEIDGTADLCADSEAPACVGLGDTAMCGCTLDVDCGSVTSGRVCDRTTHQCIDGCSALANGNGCPDQQECVVADEEVGRCMPASSDPGGDDDGGSSSGGSPDAGLVQRDPSGCGCRTDGAPATPWLLLLLFFLPTRRKKRMPRPLGALSCTVLLSPGCADETATSCSNLSEALIAHSCSHARHGPFIAGAAQDSLPGFEVSAIHHAYELALPEDAPGNVFYRPSRDGLHVLLTDADVEIFELDSADPLPPVLVDGCDALSQGVVVELEAGVGQTFTLEGDGPIVLFIEHAESFSDDMTGSCSS